MSPAGRNDDDIASDHRVLMHEIINVVALGIPHQLTANVASPRHTKSGGVASLNFKMFRKLSFCEFNCVHVVALDTDVPGNGNAARSFDQPGQPVLNTHLRVLLRHSTVPLQQAGRRRALPVAGYVDAQQPGATFSAIV